MKLLFDARTITPRYPGIGRYALGLLNALTDVLKDDLTVLHHPPASPPTPKPLKRFALSRDVRALSDQVITPVTLTGRFKASAVVYHSPFYIFPYLIPHPTVVTLYDLIPVLWPEGFTFLARQLYFWAHRLAAARAQHILTLSAAARNDLIQHLGLSPEKITVIPPGSSPPVTNHESRITPPYLLYVGINKPHKNLVRLIQAYAALDRQTPPLLIVGPVDARFSQAPALVEHLGLADRLRFLGHVPDDELTALYANATLFVFPSLAEGFGFPVLEAMAYGTPVVCSDIPVLRELAGEAALYFDPQQAAAIASTLAAALARADLRASLRERGLARAKEFSWTAAAQQTIEIYEKARHA